MSVSGDASPIDPDEAASREFTKARKGLDPTEVRVHLTKLTEEIRRLRGVESELRRELDAAVAEPPGLDSLDPAAMSRVLGDETVRIIDTAREASDEIRAKAEENASRVVRDAHERANRLTREAAELREAAGTEAAEVTESARSEADELLTAARSEAEAALAEAEAEAASLREEAALVLDEKTTEAQLEAVRIRGEADDLRSEAEAYAATRRSEADQEAAALAEQASLDAEVEVEDARERGREMIREAKEARERMIHDLAERRHTSRQQLEALRAGRERLIEAFTTARDALDEATDGLVDSLPSAREAADAAARAVEEDLDEAVQELDALISEGADTDELIHGSASSLPRLETDPTPVRSELSAAPSDLDIELDDDVLDDDDDELELVTFEPAASDETDTLDDDDGDDLDDGNLDDRDVAEIVLLEAVGADDDDDDDDDDDEHDEDDDDDDEHDEDLTDGSSALGDEAEAPQLGRLRLVSSNDGEPTPIGLEALVNDDDDDDEDGPDEPHSAEVEELFARLRAGRDDDDDFDDDDDDDDFDDDDDDDERVGAEVTAIGGAVVIDLSSGDAAADIAEADESDVVDLSDPVPEAADLDDEGAAAQQAMLDRRDALLGDASQGLSRRVRRVVTDQENEVLDLVRRNRKLKSSDDLLPSRDAQIEAYRTAIHKDLREVLAAGADFLASGNELEDLDVERYIDELMVAVGDWGVDPLRLKLARVVDDSDDTSPDRNELVDRLRATYREWRNDRIGELSGDIATLGFSKGVMGAAAPGQKLCWIVDHGGLPCPDGEDNQLAGPVTVGDEFPTGDLCPPAHPGCRCLLVPATR